MGATTSEEKGRLLALGRVEEEGRGEGCGRGRKGTKESWVDAVGWVGSGRVRSDRLVVCLILKPWT